MKPTPIETKATETKAEGKVTKALNTGTMIGRAVDKLASINDAEVAELAQSPSAIKEKFAKKRDALFAELNPNVRAAVIAAAVAMAAPKVAAE